MFDVKPVKRDGSLDLEKIREIKRMVVLPEKEFGGPLKSNSIKRASNLRLADVVDARIRPVQKEPAEKSAIRYDHFFEQPHDQEFKAHPEKLNYFFENTAETHKQKFEEPIEEYELPLEEQIRYHFPERTEPVKIHTSRKKKRVRKTSLKSKIRSLKKLSEKLIPDFRKSRIKIRREKKFTNMPAKGIPYPQKFGYAFSFSGVLLLFSLIVPSLSFVQKAFDTKAVLVATGEAALGQFAEAKDNLSASQFDMAAVDFSESYQILSSANNDIRRIGGNFSEFLRFVPGISKVASANYVVSAGVHFSLAGKSLAESAKSVETLGNPLDGTNQSNGPSLTDLFLNLRDGIQKSSDELSHAQEDLSKVNIDDLPDQTRSQFSDLKIKLPVVNSSLNNFLEYSRIFLDVLGYNGPRKYLFLFENNQEMRATGGFVGSYGILDISTGRVKKLFVDDIYNPDGQLQAKVIPPAPIQKMSAVWTMHDANWFPDFPTSAEKVAWFYEKTGGPTVDGVIAVTPELLEDLLKVTGPIDMPEYDKTIDADNFIEETQQEVEVDYDKEQNQPKKIIADLTPKILDKVFSEKGLGSMMQTLKAFDSALSEKHLLLYSRNYNIEKLISAQKWSGEILNTDKDYLSVINSNINGYKTDGVIDETIEHHSDIQSDGNIVDTVSITRKHNGGNEKYDWWNKVNGDWMRVYVPKDAKLVSVEGQTREVVPQALDYDSLGFKKDPQVQSEEDSTRIDESSGTKIYADNNKTVFANWVYVSPGESVTITYKYVLPFKLSFDSLHNPVDSFSVLYQKQSGSLGSRLISQINLPQNMKPVWRWPDDLKQNDNSYKMETVLDTDKFVGMAVENRQ